MSLTTAEITDVRRFCGYPAHGAAAAGFNDWQYYNHYGQLEYRITHLSDPELVIVRRYLATLTNLEVAVPRAGENLDTDQASIWTRNKDEARDRLGLLDEWRKRLCGFIGVPPGPALAAGAVTLIV
jgi:hypothetical protein